MKNLDYTYNLFKRNHSMGSKIIEHGIILLHKYKLEQTEVISRFLFTLFLTNYKIFWSDSRAVESFFMVGGFSKNVGYHS